MLKQQPRQPNKQRKRIFIPSPVATTILHPSMDSCPLGGWLLPLQTLLIYSICLNANAFCARIFIMRFMGETNEISFAACRLPERFAHNSGSFGTQFAQRRRINLSTGASAHHSTSSWLFPRKPKLLAHDHNSNHNKNRNQKIPIFHHFHHFYGVINKNMAICK